MCMNPLGGALGAVTGGKAPTSGFGGLLPMMLNRKKKDAGGSPTPGKGALAAVSPVAAVLK